MLDALYIFNKDKSTIYTFLKLLKDGTYNIQILARRDNIYDGMPYTIKALQWCGAVVKHK